MLFSPLCPHVLRLNAGKTKHPALKGRVFAREHLPVRGSCALRIVDFTLQPRILWFLPCKLPVRAGHLREVSQRRSAAFALRAGGGFERGAVQKKTGNPQGLPVFFCVPSLKAPGPRPIFSRLDASDGQDGFRAADSGASSGPALLRGAFSAALPAGRRSCPQTFSQRRAHPHPRRPGRFFLSGPGGGGRR